MASNKPLSNSRWFRTISDRFDWQPKRNVIVSWKFGEIGYGTKECIAEGLALNAIELIKKPHNASISKSGKVIFNDK